MPLFATYWEDLEKRNPTLAAARIRITTVSLKGITQHAHRSGFRHGAFEIYWETLVKQSPSLRATRVEISTLSVKSIAQHAFGETEEELQKLHEGMRRLFDGLFGGQGENGNPKETCRTGKTRASHKSKDKHE